MPISKPYEHDLAQIHDQGYGAFARNAAPGILKILREAGIKNGRIVDLGCGSGIWAKEVVDSGYNVIGVDISPAMIEISSQRVPQAEFHVESFLKFAIPPCRAITALGEVMCYLFDTNNSPRSLRRVCQNAFKALDRGGLLIFDIAEPNRSKDLRQNFRIGENWACIVEYFNNPKKQRLTRQITSFLKNGELYHRHAETHVLQLYRGTIVAKMLREIGFRVRMVRTYGHVPFPESLVGFVARKP